MSKLNNFAKFKLEGLETVNGGLMAPTTCVFTCCDTNEIDVTTCSDDENDE